MRYQIRDFSAFSSEPSTRFDFNYIKSVSITKEDYYSYKDLFEIVPFSKPSLDKNKPFRYAEIGNVTKRGEVFPVTLSFDDRNELNEDLFKKIEKGDIILPERGNILISTIRPYLNKNVLIEDTDETDENPIYFTKAFLQIKPKINNRILYYLLRTILFEKVNAVSRQGKGYPTLKDYDLKAIQFPKKLINNLLSKEKEFISQLDVVEKEIKELKSIQRGKSDIVDEIFSNHFKINIQEVLKIDSQKKLCVNISDINGKNTNIRNSYRWNKMGMIQNYLYKNLTCIEPLGKYITHLNNGWSPESIEGGEGIPVLGQEHFEFDGTLNVSPTKATIKTKNNISNFFIQKGDFFVSRGNTVGLVGIASVVEDEINENVIYPDLYIRVNFSAEINIKYLALLFNSFIGRLYFKYVSKGKNQSMVKISSNELYNYYLPKPSLNQQEELVTKVEEKINAQREIEQQIEQKQDKISELIMTL